MLRKRAKISLLLSGLFVIVYGSLNWLTSLRPDVGSFYFPFEKHIPFVPAMIVPYLSIDLFYVLSPFFCRDDRQCRVFIRRMIFGLLISGLCFALFPLKFAFARPHVPGLIGQFFDWFRSVDAPFNQLPSLHIFNVMMFLPVFLARGGRVWKAFIIFWLSLIGVSTVLTYQHHLIDIAGGFLLGAIAFHIFPDDESADSTLSFEGLSAVGKKYLIGSGALVLAAYVLRPVGWLLLWPALSLLIVTIGYAGADASIFHKRLGRLPITTWLLLWPALLGQRVSRAYYSRQCNAWDRLTDHIWIGRALSDAEAQRAVSQGVCAVLDLTGEFSEARPFLQLPYLQLPILDLTAPSQSQLHRAIDFIATAPGVVYIHCKIGYSRTAAVAGSYLIASGTARHAAHAVALLRQARPSIIIRPEAMAAIEQFEQLHSTSNC
jgi:membrane-associated phospholipid phosphatase